MRVLEGVTVIDFTVGYGGPFCTMQLADFGARVIKVEQKGGDEARRRAPLKNGHSGYFASVNRNKYSIEADFSSGQGIEMVKNLTKTADIVVECFKPGVMGGLGFGYEDIIKYNPEVIYASLSSFGQTGPMSHIDADDSAVQAMSGLMDMTGFPDGPPSTAGAPVGEGLGGLNAALGIVMAYYQKLLTGKGQNIDVSMLDSLFGILESPVLFQSMLGIQATRCGNNDAATLVPYDTYECKDGYFSVGIASDSGWGKFTEAIEMPELYQDPRFESNEKRCGNFKELDPVLRSCFKNKTKEELAKAFSAAGIPNSPVLSVPEVMGHPQLDERGMIVELRDPGVGLIKCMGNPMKMDKTPPVYEKAAPLLGEDTEAILREVLV